MSFESFSFDRRILAGITACGYETPTPIQQQAIPAVLKGGDVLGLAQTGTGKTAAFALPILQHLIDDDANRRGPVRVLVLAPTRELALQIQETFVALGKQTGYRSAAVFGGVGIVPQIRALRGSSIAVACPGRLLDLMNRGECDLSAVDTLVLDEADRMFDMGFLPDLRRILSRLPAQRQNLLFSATMPAEIRTLAGDLLHDPQTIQVDYTQPKTSIEHVAYRVPQRQKTGLLEALLKETDHESVLVFTRTKHRAKNVARVLGERGWRATSLQGNLSQNRRQEALDGFRNGKYTVMVATDIAARGIDCASISHVINYDLPDTPETYTHRIGRTGRANRTGVAMTLLTDEDTAIMRLIERAMGKMERRKVEGFTFAPESAETDADSRDERTSRFSRTSRQSQGRGGESRFGRTTNRNGHRTESAHDADQHRTSRPAGQKAGRGRSDDERQISRGTRSPYADQLGAEPSGYARAARSFRKDNESGNANHDRDNRGGRYRAAAGDAGKGGKSENGSRWSGQASAKQSEHSSRDGRYRAATGEAGKTGKPGKGGKSENGSRWSGQGSAKQAEHPSHGNRSNWSSRSNRPGQSGQAGQSGQSSRSGNAERSGNPGRSSRRRNTTDNR